MSAEIFTAVPEETVSPADCLRLLKSCDLTLATAESCTGGLIAQRITAVPGASAVYRGGIVSYWTELKASILGVSRNLLDRDGAVAESTARAMAEGAQRITGAETAVSVTGVAGPDSDERGNPVGRVFVGLAAPGRTFCRHLELGALTREEIRDAAARHAFAMLARYLNREDPEVH